jgi:predicted nucleic acid-binding protein
MYLLDTNVISELRKAETRRADRNVKAWVAKADSGSMFLSVVTLMELELGTLLMERRDRAQGVALRLWLESQVLTAFTGRILAVDTRVAQRCAALHVPNPRSERDAFIAATALVHGMTVVTRNTSDFEGTGAALLNPWTSA